MVRTRFVAGLCFILLGLPVNAFAKNPASAIPQSKKAFPSISISTPDIISPAGKPVTFTIEVNVHKDKKAKIEAFFPDENHPVQLISTSNSKRFTFTADPANFLSAGSFLKVQIYQEAKKKKQTIKTVIASESMPVFLSTEQMALDSEAFLQINDRINAKIKLHPSVVFTNTSALAFFEIQNNRRSDRPVQAIVHINDLILATVPLVNGLNKWEVLLPSFSASSNKSVTLTIVRVNAKPPKRSIGEVSLDVRVANSIAPDPRFPKLQSSDLARLFNSKWLASGSDVENFLSLWQSSQIQYLAKLFLVSIGIQVLDLPSSNGFLDFAGSQDINCDGITDLVIADPKNGKIQVMLANASNSNLFQAPIEYSVGSKPSRVLEADLNLDGIIDLVVPNSGSGDISVLMGSSGICGSFSPLAPFKTGDKPDSLLVSDLDQDQIPDLVIGHNGSNTVSVLKGIGDGTFSPSSKSYSVCHGPYTFNTVFNPAGNAEVEVACSGSNLVSTLSNSGNGDLVVSHAFDFGPGFNLGPDVPRLSDSGIFMDYGPLYEGGASGSGCQDLSNIFSDFEIRIASPAQGAFGKIPNTDDLNNVMNFSGGLGILGLGFTSKCLGFDLRPPFLTCEQNRSFFIKIFGISPEDLILNLVPFLGDDLRDFLRPRFNVCTGFNLSGLSCDQLIDIGGTIASIALPGLGLLFKTPIAKFLFKLFFCMDIRINIDFGLPNIDLNFPSFSFGFGSHCWFFCGPNSDSDDRSTPFHPGSEYWWKDLNNFDGTGGGPIPGYAPSCSVLPSNFLSLDVGGMILYSQQTGYDVTRVVGSAMACGLASPVLGIPDLNPPKITVLTPVDQQRISGPDVHVTGWVDDISSTVQINGQPFSTSRGPLGRFIDASIPFPIGGAISIQAIDSSGNIGNALVHVLRPSALARLLSTATHHACAIFGDTLKCWGANDSSQIGPNNLVNVTSVATASGSPFVGHTCAVVDNSSLSCWGNNNWGQLGNGTTGGQFDVPEIVGGLPLPIKEVAAGVTTTCALAGGTVYCWGWLFPPAPGGTIYSTPQSMDIILGIPALGSGVKKLYGGYNHYCAVSQNDRLVCFGENAGDPLGGATVDNLSKLTFTQFATCALSLGVVRCAGTDIGGELNGLRNAGPLSNIAGSRNHTCGVLSDGSLRCWGFESAPIPSNISGTIGELEIGSFSGCAIIDGNVKCWGFISDVPQ